MKEQPEYELQKSVAKYISLQYPKADFLSDTVAFLKLTMQQAVRNKAIQKKGFKCPDLLILEPYRKDGAILYCGLFIELKVESPYYKKDPTILKANPHIEAQMETILRLQSKGYYAVMLWDYDEITALIDAYLKGALK